MDANSDWAYSLDASDHLWLSYYDESRMLRLRDPKGAESLLVPAGRAQSPSGLAMAARSAGAAVLWRDKYPEKGLYLFEAPSDEIRPQEVGGDTEPLARFVAETDGQGKTHLLWYGEKATEASSDRYNLYYRNWRQSDQALSEIALVMPGIYPVMAVDPGGSLMAFSWQSSDGPQRIASRFRPADAVADKDDGGFRAEVTVAEVPSITPIFEALRLGSRWMVLWVGQYGLDRRDFRLEGAYSDDDGARWTRFGFDDLKGFDIASLQTASDAEGHLMLAITARNRQVDDRAKQDVYLIRSADRGSTWSKASPLRAPELAGRSATEEDRNLLAFFHARNPSVAFGETPGEILVVWEDWRTIRSGLYASLSKDFGETWALSNVPLPRPRGTNLGLRYEPGAIYVAGGSYHVLAERYADDTFKSKQLVQIDVAPAVLSDYAKQRSESMKADEIAGEAQLRQRAEGYWQAMRDGEFEKAYDYLDPFFKAVTPLNAYVANMGKIKYAEAKVEDIKIQGPLAEVNTKIRASVPAFKVPTTGAMMSQPEREALVKNRWLWLDGEWVNEFRVESQDAVFTRY
ncbi:hypothetical protein CKO23_09240 [Thiocystis violacea]|nr:hypothetical protein [Thiocystis violacea]